MCPGQTCSRCYDASQGLSHRSGLPQHAGQPEQAAGLGDPEAKPYIQGRTLVAAYTAYSGPHGAMVATALPMLTMAPRLRCFMPGSTRRVICAA